MVKYKYIFVILLFFVIGIFARNTYKIYKKKENIKLIKDSLKNRSLQDFEYNIDDISYIFRDLKYSVTSKIVSDEMKTDYRMIKDISFSKGDVMIDIGANIGMVSIVVAKNNPNIKIYSYEPSEINFNNLKYNISKNNIKNIIANQYGIGNKTETVDFYVNASNSGASGIKSHPWSEEEKSTVKIVSLSEELKRQHINKIKFFKIDCEGCELDVFENMSEDTMKNIEYILGEIDCDNDLDRSRWSAILTKLKKYIDNNKMNFVGCRLD